MASTSFSRPGAGLPGSHCRSFSVPGATGWRTSLITRWPPVVSSAVSAVPIRPLAPVTATVSGSGCRARAQRWAFRSAASCRCRSRTSDAARPRVRGLHVVADPGGAVARLVEAVHVPPAHHAGQRGGGQAAGHQLVNELPGRRSRPAVLRDPARPAGQQQHRAAVFQRAGLLAGRYRCPWRRQPGQRARPPPREHLVDRRVHHAGVADAHGLLVLPIDRFVLAANAWSLPESLPGCGGNIRQPGQGLFHATQVGAGGRG